MTHSAAAHYASFGLPPADRGGYVIAAVRGDLGIASAPEVTRVLSATGMNYHLDSFPTIRAAITGQPGLAAAILAPVVLAHGRRVDGVIAGADTGKTPVASQAAR